jgi:hypothetical protein
MRRASRRVACLPALLGLGGRAGGGGGGGGGPERLGAGTSALRVVTWNVAAINNNPFEYWITHDDDPRYDHMMRAVRLFVEEDEVGPSARRPAALALAQCLMPRTPLSRNLLGLLVAQSRAGRRA